MRAVSLIAIVVLLISCKNESCRNVPEASPESVSLEIERMEAQLFNASNPLEIENFLRENTAIAEGLMHSDQYPALSTLSSRLSGLIRDPHIDTLYREATNTFEDYEEQFREEMETAFGWLKYYYPETETPTVQTMVTGLYNDVYITDSLLVLSIDFFIGEDASFRPLDLPQYILRRYSSEYMVPTMMKFYLDSYAKTGKENSLLSEMIDYGKLYYFIGKILPCMEDWRIMGYTEEEMRESKENQEIIWANFIENEILYDNTEEMKRRFLGERPKVYEIGESCPGRIGAWVGWEIVKAYAERSGASLKEIMEETDHHRIFSESKYKPVNQ